MSLFALGGNAGYALGSLAATPVMVHFGISGAPLLALPGVVMVLILIRYLARVLDGRDGSRRARPGVEGRDDWRSFGLLIAVVVLRSVVFLALTSFLGVYFVRYLGTSEAAGGAVVTTFLFAGAIGTIGGGWLADRWDRMWAMRLGLALSIPGLAGLLLSPNAAVATFFVVFLGVALYLPFAVMITLGQDYLPNRIGTASGVTVGLPTTVGGLFAPALGALADHTSLALALGVVVIVPAIALVLAVPLKDPQRSRAESAP